MNRVILLIGSEATRDAGAARLRETGFATRAAGISDAEALAAGADGCYAVVTERDDARQTAALLASLAGRLPVVVRAPKDARALFDATIGAGTMIFLDATAADSWVAASLEEGLRLWHGDERAREALGEVA